MKVSDLQPERPLTLPLRLSADQKNPVFTEADFLERQAQLQAEARVALVQAKDMAHMQMEMERQRMNASPITEMIRNSLQKVSANILSLVQNFKIQPFTLDTTKFTF